MSDHPSLRARFEVLRKHGEPVFEASTDPTLVAFAQLFVDSELVSFDANKHLRTDALSPIYDCETESISEADPEVQTFVVTWTPVWSGTAPVTGFRSGQDSVAFGSTPTVAMPQDERTAARLLLVTSAFVHLSAHPSASGLLIQGALEDEDGRLRFVSLEPAALPRPSNAVLE